MQISKTSWRPGKRPVAESIYTTTAGRTRPWDWPHRTRCTAAARNFKMKLSFPSAPFRFATLTSTTRWGRKGKRKQQQPTTREKVPNWFQDLTDPLDTDAEGLSDLTEHLLGL